MKHVSETAQRLNIRQIADLAGVSIATVSRVLNGRGDVSEETRELVSRVIRENGYTANRSARGLSAGRTGLVGVLVPLVFPAYFSGILAGAAEALSERDFQIVLSPTGGEHEREVSIVDRLHGLTDGALIILPEESSEELERLLDSGFRFVVLDPLMPLEERIPSVSAAHTSGADQAMKHLLDLGHRRVGQITGPRGWVATEDRRWQRPESFLIPPSSRRPSQRSTRAVRLPNSYSISPSGPPRSLPSTTTSRSARSRLLARAEYESLRSYPSSDSTTSSTRQS